MEKENKKEKEEIVWDNEIGAWVWKANGYVIAPRLDSDGWDFFLVKSKEQEYADARYCSGERYWAYINLSEQELETFIEMVQKIKEKVERKIDSEIEKEAVHYLPF